MEIVPITIWQNTNMWIYWLLFCALLFVLIPVLQKKNILSDAFYSLFLQIDATNNNTNINLRNIECIAFFMYITFSLQFFLSFYHNEETWINFVWFTIFFTIISAIKVLFIWAVSYFTHKKKSIPYCIKNYVQILFFCGLLVFTNTLVYVNFDNFDAFILVNLVAIICYSIILFIKFIKFLGVRLINIIQVVLFMLIIEILPIYLLYLYSSEEKI